MAAYQSTLGWSGAQYDAALAKGNTSLQPSSIDTLAKLNALINDATLLGSAAFGAVATSNSYNDLDDKPTLGTAAAEDVGAFEGAGAVASHLLAFNHSSFITLASVTYESLNTNGDVGTGATQLARGNHTHAGIYEPADATILKEAAIGNTVQAYDANTAKLNGTEAFTAAQTFNLKASYSSHPTFTGDTELVDKKYVDDAVTASGGYSDENAQDAVGGMLTNSSSISFTYNDTAGTITAAVILAGVNHNNLAGYDADQHIDWSVSVPAKTVHVDNIPDLSATYEGADTTILKEADIGVNVAAQSHNHSGIYEPADADIAKTDVAQNFSALQTFGQMAGGTDTTASATGTQAIVADYKDKFLTLTGNIDITLSVPSGAVKAGCVIILKQDATGGRTVTWNTTVVELGTQALNTTADGYSIWIAWTPNGGTDWFLTSGGTNA
jgi:ribosomal protein L31